MIIDGNNKMMKRIKKMKVAGGPIEAFQLEPSDCSEILAS